MNLANWIERQADFAPRKCAIRFEGRDSSYVDLAQEVARLADVLAAELGVGRGDRVAYLGLNSPDIVVLLFACASIGAVLMPMNWRLAAPEHIGMLRHARPCSWFVKPEFVDHVADISGALGPIPRITYGAARDGWLQYERLLSGGNGNRWPRCNTLPDDPVLLCYTSGTTGRPKGALLSHRALAWNAVNATHMHDLARNDVVLTVLPMFHVGGLNIQTLPALHAGATVVIHSRFRLEPFFDALEQDGVTLTLLVPTIVHAMLNDPRWQSVDLGKLRMISVGSMVVPEQLVLAVGERGVPLVQVYGSTETSPIAAYMPVPETMRRPASTGKAAMHCEIRLVDEQDRDVASGEKGEILVRGPNLMNEYWDDPDATREAFSDGWFHTGDIAHRDSDGFLYVVGRSKDTIISGGENIHPAVVENVLALCPELKEVAVIGRPDDYWGEVVVAVVVPKGREHDPQKILDFCAGRIARFEIPREVFFVDQLPRNAMGKIMKEKVRELVLQETAGKPLPVPG